ncbi:hypothetical protein ACJX0J_038561, partial [Zea mays]
HFGIQKCYFSCDLTKAAVSVADARGLSNHEYGLILVCLHVHYKNKKVDWAGKGISQYTIRQLPVMV